MSEETKDVDQIFWEALQIEDAERRDAYIRRACGDDEQQHLLVEKLIKAQPRIERFLEQPFQLEAISETSSTMEGPGKEIGPYRLREQIGEGGMGVVFVAEQMEPVRRKVALKIIKPGMASKDVVSRFEAERQALAMMDHPNIARVFDGGATDAGLPYFVMELVQGLSITAYCDQKCLTTHERLELFVQVCRAVQHAHQKGIIHRDLKPSNVVVGEIDARPVPKVIDFGVAKAVNERLTEQTVYTKFSQMVGTPLYMSPEQAGLGIVDVDTRSDVYSLGVLLYELLTGETPFDRETLKQASFDEMRRIIREDEPPRPSSMVSTLQVQALSTVAERRRVDGRKLADTLRGELDWIVMKALEKDRDRRYESAGALADDVARFLNNQQVEACPPSALYRFRKLASRQKKVLFAASLVFLALLIGTVASLWQARRADNKANQALAAQQLANREALAAQTAKAWSQTLLYAADMKLASDALAKGDATRSAELLDRHSGTESDHVRSFEWHLFHKRVAQHCIVERNLGGEVVDVEVSPDGKYLAATAGKRTVQIYETTTWKRHQTVKTCRASVNALAWSSDGQLLAAPCADGSLCIWNLSSGKQRLEITAHEGGANDCCFSPDGRQLYSCGDDGLAKSWNVDTGQQQLEFVYHQREVERIALSPDGQLLATASSDEDFAVWKTSNAERLYKIDTNSGRVLCISFSTNGQLVAAGTIHGNVLLADAQTGQLEQLMRQPDGVEALCFISGGNWLAAADRGGAIQLHRVPLSLDVTDPDNSTQPIRWIAHAGRALSAAPIPGGRGLVSGGRDGMLRVWQPDCEATRWYTFRHADPVTMAVGPNKRLYVAGRKVFVWDLHTRRLVNSFADSQMPWRCVACSADGNYLAAVCPGRLVLFELRSRQIVNEWEISDDASDPFFRLAISKDGRWIALAEYSEQDYVAVYDRDRPQWLQRLPARKCMCLAFSPDDRWLAAGHMDDIRLFNFRSAAEPRILKGHSSTVSDVAFSPDGRLLATVSHDRLLKIWQLPTGHLRHSIVAHWDYVKSVAFTPDGNTLATGGEDGEVKLWHVATSQPLGQLMTEHEGIHQIRFDSDGLVLCGQLQSRTVVIYDATPDASSSARKPLLGAEFCHLGDLRGGPFASIAQGVSSDGQFVVGFSNHERGFSAFRWSRSEGMRPFRVGPRNNQAEGISDDGLLFCGSGTTKSGWRGLTWTRTGEVKFVAPPDKSNVEDMTADGAHVVGNYWINDRWNAFRRSHGKLILLPSPPEYQHAEATAVSSDGRIVLGWVYNTDGDADLLSQRDESVPKILDARAVIWNDEGLVFLPGFDPHKNWRPTEMSDDGSVVVGVGWPPGTHYLWHRQRSGIAFRWENGQTQLLGSLESFQNSLARSVSGDGRLVVGRCVRRRGNHAEQISAGFVWDASHGLRAISEVMAEAGVNLDGMEIQDAMAISKDGSTIVGVGTNKQIALESWLARLPTE